MAQVDTKKLDSGDPFPELELKLVDRKSLTIPRELKLFLRRWALCSI